MTLLQKSILFLLVLAMIGTAAWVVKSESGLGSYFWFRDQLARQDQRNQRAAQQNLQLRRRVIALRYDRRVQEREVRDLLSLTREGEILVILKK